MVITPFNVPLLASLLVFATMAPVFGNDDPFNYGVLACVAQLQRVDPSQPPDLKSDSVNVLARTSAFFVRDSSERVFLVTAAHNLVDCTDVKITHDRFGTRAAPRSIIDSGSKLYFNKYIYFDQAEDLVVLQLKKDEADQLLLLSKPEQKVGTTSSLGKVVGTTWESKSTAKQLSFMPRGGLASSAGTVSEGFVAKSPAYSCTISRYLKGNEFPLPVRTSYKNEATRDRTSFRGKIVDRIHKQQFLIVESMSIRAGFSGSPIVISNDHFFENGDIIGAVLGGNDQYEAGRMAWAVPSSTIKEALKHTAKANERIEDLGWKWPYSQGNSQILEDPSAAGRWVTSLDLATLSSLEFEPFFQSPYSQRYSIESQVEFKGTAADSELCEHKLARRIEKLPGRAFRFENITFKNTCLDNINLLSPYFKNCTFKATRFHASVLTGAVFDGCRFFDSNQDEKNIEEILGQKLCAACSPAALIAPRFKGRYEAPEIEDDDIIKLK